MVNNTRDGEVLTHICEHPQNLSRYWGFVSADQKFKKIVGEDLFVALLSRYFWECPDAEFVTGQDVLYFITTIVLYGLNK